MPRFYKGIWQDGKRHYRFKNKLENPAAVMRDLLKRSGIYDLPNFDKEQADKTLGQMYLYCDEKIEGFTTERLLLIKPEEVKMAGELRQELAELLNRHSRENKSNSPDFLLANFMLDCLQAGEELVRAREQWYGVKHEPGK